MCESVSGDWFTLKERVEVGKKSPRSLVKGEVQETNPREQLTSIKDRLL